MRLVGWDEHDAGYHRQRARHRHFPDFGHHRHQRCAYVQAITTTTSTPSGGRARAEDRSQRQLDDQPTFMGQATRHANGTFAYDPAVGDLETSSFLPDEHHDPGPGGADRPGQDRQLRPHLFGRATRRAITRPGLHRLFVLLRHAVRLRCLFPRQRRPLINPSQYIIGRDHYTKTSHELRIASPQATGCASRPALFLQRQTHEIIQDYLIDGLRPTRSRCPAGRTRSG